MKLELKHLAPYLPYGLKYYHLILKCTEIVIGFEEYQNNDRGEGQTVRFKGYCADLDDPSFKPILRPLSDLSKLGVDGVAINEHTINLMIEEKFNEEYGLFQHYKGHLELVKEGDSSQRYDSQKAISFEVFEEIRNELLKGHYDLFGLIEKGLAIDINSLSLADA